MNTRILPMALAILACAILCNAERATAQFSVTFDQASHSAYDSNATLIVTTPAEGAVVTLDTPCVGCPPQFEFDATLYDFMLMAQSEGAFPCASSTACDTCLWKGDGQHIYIILDNGPSIVVGDLNVPVYLPLHSPAPGPHTLRVYMSRSWDESLKNTGSVSPNRVTNLYTVRTFYVGSNTGAHAIDSTLPLLTPNSPLDTHHYKYPPDSVLLDFYLMFEGLSDGYRVEATVYDSTMGVLGRDTLTEWAPYCIDGLQEPPVGRLRKYFIRTRLLDTSGVPVSNGPGNFNDRQWPFWVRRN